MGIMLRMLENMARRNQLFAILANVLKMSWSVVSFLTVPAIVIDGMGPIKGLKRSRRYYAKLGVRTLSPKWASVGSPF